MLLSRVTRELNKRMLCVFSVWKVKSLQFQLVSTSKKRELGENLFTEDQELEEVVPRDWESYLDTSAIRSIPHMATTHVIATNAV